MVVNGGEGRRDGGMEGMPGRESKREGRGHQGNVTNNN